MVEGLTSEDHLSVNDVLPLCCELLRCGGEEQQHLCYTLARTNFISLTTDLLKGDFSKDLCPWTCAMEYCDALLIVLSRTLLLDYTENEDLVTKVVSAHLVLACRIQDRYILSMELTNRTATTGKRFIKLYRCALQKLTNLCEKFHRLTTLTLESQWFLQIFVTDFEELSLAMLGYLHSIFDYEESEAVKNDTVYTQISRHRLLIILDEIVYALSRDCSDDLFLQSARSVIQAIYHMPEMASCECVVIITNEPITVKGKRTVRVRSRLQRKRREKEEARLEAELRHQLAVSRRRARRERDENELELLTSLPAGELIGQHFANRRREAAVKVQVKLGFADGGNVVILAASRLPSDANAQPSKYNDGTEGISLGVTIQRKGSLHRVPREPFVKDFPRVHRKWRSTHLPKPKTPEELENLHARTQLLLRKAILRRLGQVSEENRRTLKIAQVRSDAQILADELSGKLESSSQGGTVLARAVDRSASRPDGALFHCRSQPIASLARVQHLLRMRALEKPWWRQWQEEWQKAVSTGIFSSLARMPTDLQDLDDSYEERAFGVPPRPMSPTQRRPTTHFLREGGSALTPSPSQGRCM
ncbi:unnamed protein product [Schistocephalus solidus]|uniref:Uncharacterized protein n=1 Tax=Schistocephalus solidus TaxID=70667 RepID=A0A183SKX1_SCHSO|nr:unnamed protein product [Schistocephalus solidus]